jgi:RNA polymerase sigma factor (TIGR02999 family)
MLRCGRQHLLCWFIFVSFQCRTKGIKITTSSADLSQSDDKRGARSTLAECLPVFYDEMRRLARSRLAGGHYTLLDTTGLVHESFLRLQRVKNIDVNDTQHFLAYAASTMRSVVVDYVRQRSAERRGGAAVHEPLDTQHAHLPGASDEEILEVNDALEALAAVDERLVRVVEMRYFGGMTDAEIGQALGVTDRTVRRDWDRARLLLAGLLGR